MGKWLNGARLVRQRMEEKEEKLRTLEHRLSLPVWAELESGVSVRVGDRVRWGNREYTCVIAHTKSNARHPRSGEYWQQIGD